MIAALAVLGVLRGGAAAAETKRHPFTAVDEQLLATGRLLTLWKDCQAKRQAQLAELQADFERQLEEIRRSSRPKLAPVPAQAPAPSEPLAVAERQPAKPLDEPKPVVQDPATVEKCERAFKLDDLSARKDRGEYFVAMLAVPELERYLVCRAAADHGACNVTGKWGQAAGELERTCLKTRDLLLFGAAVAAGKRNEAWQHCEGLLTRGFRVPQAKLAALRQPVCQRLVEGDAERACAALKAATGAGVEECAAAVRRSILGQRERGKAPKGARAEFQDAGNETEIADFKQALSKGSAEACPSDGVCRVLMGQPPDAACERRRHDLARALCSLPEWRYKPESAAERQRKLAEYEAARKASEATVRSGIQKTLASPPTPPASPPQAAYETKRKALEKSCEQLSVEAVSRYHAIFGLLSEARGLPGLDERAERYQQLGARMRALQRSEGKPSKPLAPRQ